MKVAALFVISLLVLSGCATELYPTQMLEVEVQDRMKNMYATSPSSPIYKTYTSRNLKLTFDRVDENNVLYGWWACTNNCSWGKSKVLAIYDGRTLNLAFGHHEDFMNQAPDSRQMHPKQNHWSWGTIDKYKVTQGRLAKVASIRKCPYDSPTIQEWSNTYYAVSGDYDCRYVKQGSYSQVFTSSGSATIKFPSDILAEQQAAEAAAAAAEKKRQEAEAREASLPVSVRRDKYMILLSSALKQGDYEAALEIFPKLEKLDISKDPSLDFFYGEALLKTGNPTEAIEKLYRYVSEQGSGATHYARALELINSAESSL